MNQFSSTIPGLTLILGGARAGKSAFAQQLGMDGSRVLFVATAAAGDGNMAQRIARHRAERPSAWETAEEPIALTNTLAPIASRFDTIIIDCMTMWASNVLLAAQDADDAEEVAAKEIAALLNVMRSHPARWIVVSNEVGLGVVPATTLGRDYRDLLGRANQRVAGAAERVAFLVAGIPMELKPWESRSDSNPPHFR